MIIITGAAGFIGSVLLGKLNQEKIENIILVDDFSNLQKQANYQHKKYQQKIDREDFFTWCENQENIKEIDFIFHIGACSSTLENRPEYLEHLNTDYSKKIFQLCTHYQIPLIYASSAATYGDGEFGYQDDEQQIFQLKPLNLYGISKQKFDEFVLTQKTKPPFFAGFKFFNVYGPNEYHKGRMASVIYHAFHQIQETGKIKLFKSYHPNYQDGQQKRDFIYVKDVVEVLFYFYKNHQNLTSGIYNLGSGQAETFLTLAESLFKALHQKTNIEFVEMPDQLKDKYQYFTQASMEKLHQTNYSQKFYTLEEGILDYVQHYLLKNNYF